MDTLSKSLTTPVSQHITRENHIPRQVYVTQGSLTSPELVTSLTFKDLPLPTYDILKQEDSCGLNVSNVDSNITDPDLTPGCFEIECVYGQEAKDEYNTEVSLFKCDKWKDIVCDKCCKDGAYREYQKYLKPNNNGWIIIIVKDEHGQTIIGLCQMDNALIWYVLTG